jgi:peptidoglycan/LPS O-acetylase OafA/YrhL
VNDAKVDESSDRPVIRLGGVEALRAIAACSVVVYHCWLYSAPDHQRIGFGPLTRFVFPYLPAGVTLFFALSAFLLYRPFATSIVNRDPPPSIRRYARNRALRILPAYWFVLIVLGFVFGAALVRPAPNVLELGYLASHPTVLTRSLVFAQNYFPSTVIAGIAPAWSLCVEVVFYALLPALGWMGIVLSRSADDRRRILAALIPAGLLLVMGLSGKAVAMWIIDPGLGPSPGWDGDWYSVLVRSFWVQADLFAFGMGLAVVWAAVATGRIRLPAWWRAATVAALVPIALSTTLFGEGQVLGASGWATVLAVGCTLILALTVMGAAEGRHPGRLGRLLDTRVFVAIGLVSYSLFLWNEPLARWLSDRGLTFAGRAGFLVNLVLIAALSGVLSAITYRFVEVPALRRKVGATARSRPAASVPAAMRDADAAAP